MDETEQKQMSSLTRKKIGEVLVISIGILILLYGALLLYGTNSPEMRDLRIATGSAEYSILTYIAQDMGFFSEQGLNVTITTYPTGLAAVETLFSNTSDIAYAAEFVGIEPMNTHPDIRIIACTAKSDNIALLIRKDRNITSPQDLKNSSIAVCKGTAGEFFLGRYLTLNGMDMTEVRKIYLSPGDLISSLISGKCDAAIIWEPHVYTIQKQMGSDVLIWPAQGGQQFYWVAYTLESLIQNHPDIIQKYLISLSKAEEYMLYHDQESKKYILSKFNLTEDYYTNLMNKTKYQLNLDQGLLLALEDEERWLKQYNPSIMQKNMLMFMNETALRSIRPDAVTIIR